MRGTRKLQQLGQSVWLDNITRDLLTTGTLARYIKEFSVTGLTSNPTIFEQAIKGSAAYDEAIRAKLRDVLITHGDRYMHLADLRSYLDADRKLVELYAQPDAWARKAILNIASSGRFSSDRTIAEYASDIWHVRPCPVP